MRPQPGDDDALHVLIAGDDEERVIATTKEVEKLLVPIDETKNEHKGTDNNTCMGIYGVLRGKCRCFARSGDLTLFYLLLSVFAFHFFSPPAARVGRH